MTTSGIPALDTDRPLFMGVLGACEGWMASDACLLHRWASESKYDQCWLSCMDLNRFCRQNGHGIVHHWQSTDDELYNAESLPFYTRVSSGHLLSKARLAIRQKVAVAARTGKRLVVAVLAHGFMDYEGPNNQPADQFRRQNPPSLWPDRWGDIIIGRCRYSPSQLALDLSTNSTDSFNCSIEANITTILTHCFSSRFQSLLHTSTAASNLHESFSYPITSTIRQRARGGHLIGALVRTSTAGPLSEPVEEFLNAVYDEVEKTQKNVAALGGRKAAFWHKVVVKDLMLVRTSVFPDRMGDVTEEPDLVPPEGSMLVGAAQYTSDSSLGSSPPKSDQSLTPEFPVSLLTSYAVASSPNDADDRSTYLLSDLPEEDQDVIGNGPKTRSPCKAGQPELRVRDETNEVSSDEDLSDDEQVDDVSDPELSALCSWFVSIDFSTSEACSYPVNTLLPRAGRWHSYRIAGRNFQNLYGRREKFELLENLRHLMRRVELVTLFVTFLYPQAAPFREWTPVDECQAQNLTERRWSFIRSFERNLVNEPYLLRPVRKVGEYLSSYMSRTVLEDQQIENYLMESSLNRRVRKRHRM